MSLPKVMLGGLAVLVVAAVAGAAGWWFLIREDAKPKTNSQVITEDLKTAVATSVASTATILRRSLTLSHRLSQQETASHR